MPLDAWQRLFATNVFGLVEVTKRAVPIMRAAGGGVICNITSSSTLAPVPFLGTYRASKAAVTAIGESLAAEVAQFGIRVVEVMPGPIETDMLGELRPAGRRDRARRVPRRSRSGCGRGARASATSTRRPPKPRAGSSTRSATTTDRSATAATISARACSRGWNTTDNAKWVRGHAEVVLVITGLAHTALHVADVDAAVAWYRDVLGLDGVVAAVPDGGRRDHARHGRARSRAGRGEGGDRRRRRRLRPRHRGHRVPGGGDGRAAARRP